MPKTARALANEIESIWDAAEGRGLSADERRHMEGLVEEAKSQHELEQQIKQLDPGMPLVQRMGDGSPSTHGGPGDRFVASSGYKQVADPASRGQTFSTGMVEVSSVPLNTKGTLLETGVGGPGGGLVQPYVQPGAVEKLFEPLGVADVFGSSQTVA